MEDRSRQVLAVGTFFLILVWISISVRVYVRAVMQRSFALDDWLIVITVLFFTAYIVCQIGGIMYGTGKHMDDLDADSAQTAVHFWWFCELFYILASSWLKLSVGVFLLRVATRRTHVWIIRSVVAGTTLFGTAYYFLAIFQCKPVSFWWRRHKEPGAGVCLGPNAVLAVAYTASILNSLGDFTFGLLPFCMVRELDLPRQQKRLVAGILAFAGIGCIATIIRLPFIRGLIKFDDFLYESVDLAIWSTVEPGIGISAACVVTFRPLLQAVLKGPGWWNGSSSRQPFDRKNSQQSRSYALSQSLPNLRPDYVGNYTEITSAGVHISNPDHKDSRPSNEVLPSVYQGSGINKRVEVTFTEEVDFEDWYELKAMARKEGGSSQQQK